MFFADLKEMYKYLFGVLLLGIVVLVHEFGHFLFARIFGVRVEVFSIGFGKPLFKKKSGDTEYRISMVPLGGYVKMLGESTSEENEVEEKDLPFAFSSKKWWQKVIFVCAGPVFNLIFAFLVLLIVSFFEFSAPSSLIEFVSPDGAAFGAGISEGDTIVEINGKPVAVWEDISLAKMNISESGLCDEISVKVKKFPSNEILTYRFRPKVGEYPDAFGEKHQRCEFGVVRFPREPRIFLFRDFINLENGDIILSVDGEKIERYYELAEKIKKPFKKMTVLRGGKEISVDFTENQPEKLEIAYGGLIITSVEKGSYSEKVGVKKGDFITAVNNVEMTAPFQFYNEMRKLKEGDRVKLSVIRDKTQQDIDFVASFEEKEDEMTGLLNKRINWGASFFDDYEPKEFFAKRYNLIIFPAKYDVENMVETIAMTFKGFAYMISGKISAKGLGGPIMIFDISKRAADAGVKYFLAIMAMISINLGLINLFPVPVLDGGYVVIYTIEGILKRTIPQKAKERALMVGLFLLCALMIFAIFNDFMRYIPIFFKHN